MSYLNTSLRFHFSGEFTAAPSTVNNDLNHYNNASFDPSFQLPQTATADNGWWNPRGDHAFEINSTLRSGRYGDSTAATATDPALTTTLLTVNAPPGSIVDLDPQQQMASTLYGVRIVIPNPAGGTPFLTATLATVSFTNIWRRGLTGSGDEAASAVYQSVLESLVWGNVAGSRLLTELQAAATAGSLSIKLNIDGYHMSSTSPKFTKGRLVGTIGPAASGEPRHFVRGRHLEVPAWAGSPPMPFPSIKPVRGINYAVAVVDDTAKKVRLDLGNSLPVDPAGGPTANLGALELLCDAASATPLNLGPITYTTAGWYEATAGIVELPEGRTLTPAELALVNSKPLTFRVTSALVENPRGIQVRAEDMVYRLNPGEDHDAILMASQWGKPLAGATIDLAFGTPFEPGTGTPTTALTFPASVTTNAQGIATVRLHGGNTGNPRGFIDGQVYRVDYKLHGEVQGNLSDFLSVLVFDTFTPDTPPTWLGSMKPIFTQYGNLYPIMSDFFDLTSYDDVSANRLSILVRLKKPETDAKHMPISRDLSSAKRAAMIDWLTNVGADGKPLLGSAPPVPFDAIGPGKAERARRLAQ